MKRKTTAIRILTLAAVLAAFFVQCENLVNNPGFEETAGFKAIDWTGFDKLSVFVDKSGGNPGNCLHFDTDVTCKQWEEKQQNPEEEVKKITKRGKYSIIGAHGGAKSWSRPIEVTPGAVYLLQTDVKGPGGEPFIFLKGFRQCTASEAERRGDDTRFFKPFADGPSYSLMVGGEEKRQPVDGDWMQLFRQRLICRIPKNAENKWNRCETIVTIPSNRFRVTRILLMPFAFWPAGDYYFDNITFKQITPEEAAQIKKRKSE